MDLLIDKINIESFSIIIFFVSFLLTFLMIPKLIGVIRFKKLMDNPNNRSSHFTDTPTLAGIVFFVSLIISVFFIHYYDNVDISINIVAGLTILLIIGLKDDLVVLSAKTKIIAQLIAISFLLFNSDMNFESFHGFLGIVEIPYLVGIGLGYLIILYVINAYNLMDGIDGLAALIGILAFFIYSIFFYKMGLDVYFLLSVVSLGFLLAFLRYNVSKKSKIFMGDTGSMIVGFLLGLMTLRFIATDTAQFGKINVLPMNAIVISVSILFFPIIDVLRVIVIRTIHKKGAFTPDRRHLHHVFIDKGLSHFRASLTIIFSSIISFLIIYLSNTHLSSGRLLTLFFVVSIFIFYLLLLLDTNESARAQRKKIKTYLPKKLYMNEFRIRKAIILFLKRVFYKNLI